MCALALKLSLACLDVLVLEYYLREEVLEI